MRTLLTLTLFLAVTLAVSALPATANCCGAPAGPPAITDATGLLPDYQWMPSCPPDALAGPGCATCRATEEVVMETPDVNICGLTAFTPETQYMSLPGYLRWQVYQQNRAWLDRWTTLSTTTYTLATCPIR